MPDSPGGLLPEPKLRGRGLGTGMESMRWLVAKRRGARGAGSHGSGAVPLSRWNSRGSWSPRAERSVLWDAIPRFPKGVRCHPTAGIRRQTVQSGPVLSSREKVAQSDPEPGGEGRIRRPSALPGWRQRWVAGWHQGYSPREFWPGTCLSPHHPRAERQDPSSKFPRTRRSRSILHAAGGPFSPFSRVGGARRFPGRRLPWRNGWTGCRWGWGGVGVGAEPGAEVLAFQVPKREPRSVLAAPTPTPTHPPTHPPQL